MDGLRFHLLEIVALDAAPIFLAVLATAIAWRALSHRLLFLAVSALVLFGLAANIQPFALDYLYPNHTAPLGPAPDYLRVLIITDVLLAMLGLPVLWWLLRALRGA